jgi:hypothetical protein
VTSSGAGKILEVDLSDGKVVWEWDADEHVISSSKGPHASKQLREEYFGKDVDYRDLLIETGAQITHINTAQPLGDHQIGTTFFHQGEAIVIDKNSGSCSVVLGGLKKPHGFQKFMYQEKPAWTITDTGNGVVRVINGEFQPILNILGFFDNHPNDEISWLHTTYTYGIFLMALDQTMSQIILMDPTTRRKQTIQHSKEWKVSYLGRD